MNNQKAKRRNDEISRRTIDSIKLLNRGGLSAAEVYNKMTELQREGKTEYEAAKSLGVKAMAARAAKFMVIQEKKTGLANEACKLILEGHTVEDVAKQFGPGWNVNRVASLLMMRSYH